MCTLVFFSLPLLSSFFFYKAKGFAGLGVVKQTSNIPQGGPGALS